MEKKKNQRQESSESNNEEQVLDLGELFDVQGGTEDGPIVNCGLGCYTGGIIDPTEQHDGRNK